LLEFTESARATIRKALACTDPPRDFLRIQVGVVDGGFEYKMSASDAADVVQDTDVVIDEAGFRVALDRESAERLAGATIDWQETLLESGFRFDNPNAPASAILPQGARDDLRGSVPDRLRILLDTEINPAIAAHGGRVSLLDVVDNRVFLAFGGAATGAAWWT
jgi:Fe/S biogenesis protein NfuA